MRGETLTNSSRIPLLTREHLTQSVGARLYQNSVPGGVTLEATSKCLPRTDTKFLLPDTLSWTLCIAVPFPVVTSRGRHLSRVHVHSPLGRVPCLPVRSDSLPVSASCLLAPLRWDPGSVFLCLVDFREGLWLRAELGSTPPLPPRLGNRCPGILGTGLTACSASQSIPRRTSPWRDPGGSCLQQGQKGLKGPSVMR